MRGQGRRHWVVTVDGTQAHSRPLSMPRAGRADFNFSAAGADKHGLLELLAALAPLLSQRPSHPTDRPDPGRPRPALLPLQAVARARNGCLLQPATWLLCALLPELLGARGPRRVSLRVGRACVCAHASTRSIGVGGGEPAVVPVAPGATGFSSKKLRQ
jgi:hypothetical protein